MHELSHKSAHTTAGPNEDRVVIRIPDPDAKPLVHPCQTGLLVPMNESLQQITHTKQTHPKIHLEPSASIPTTKTMHKKS
jgi:hypothetical protein